MDIGGSQRQRTRRYGAAGSGLRVLRPGAARVRTTLLALVALALPLAGCGLKTPPRPARDVLPPLQSVQVRQRSDVAERFDGVRGYRVLVEELPLYCGACAPVGSQVLWFPAGSDRLVPDAGRVYYLLPQKASAGLFSIRVTAEYGIGAAPYSEPLVLERSVDVPSQPLHWEWAAGGKAPEGRAVRLYWSARRERVVRVIGPHGRAEAQVRYFRANLYRRVPPAPWPLTPLNAQPLEATQWIVPPSLAQPPPGGGSVEFTLRLVDTFNAEGAPSAPARIPAPGASP